VLAFVLNFLDQFLHWTSFSCLDNPSMQPNTRNQTQKSNTAAELSLFPDPI
jgi:hypothetical protein